MATSLAFIDFETTGLAPRMGDRVIEIGIAILTGGRISDRFQTLVNSCDHVPRHIESLTGISSEMISSAPKPREAFSQMYRFVEDLPLVAHNAAFDRRFLDAELYRINRRRKQDFICSLRVARRLFPRAQNHRLETLIDLAGVRKTHLHRALGDAEMTARLWTKMTQMIRQEHGIGGVPLDLMVHLQGVPTKDGRRGIQKWLRKHAT
jgi:DNA polymerase III subunit epsilon